MAADLPFPKSLPEFMRLFPDDAACARYLERIRWRDGFTCRCGVVTEPYRFKDRPGVLRCRDCHHDTALTAGTVMERTRTPLSTWFWAAYLVATHTAGMSALALQRQLGITRYETAFQILHKLRAAMVRHGRDRIGGARDHVEIDETYIGARQRGKGRGINTQTLVVGAVEVRTRAPKGTGPHVKRGGRYAGRLRLEIAPDRTADTLCGFVESAVDPATTLAVTDGWVGYDSLGKRGYEHLSVAERGDAEVAEEYLPIIHLIFSNLKAWLIGVHHGVGSQHLQAYLNEFTFRFNRRFYPFNSFRSLLGLVGVTSAPTYDDIYSGHYEHPRVSSPTDSDSGSA